MTVTLHSTLTGRDEPLIPDGDGVVGIYACGPTVYSRIHIGNARPFVVFSVLKRYLERRGLRCRLVINITDVNDKIYDAARAEGIPSPELAARCAEQYIEDTGRLGLGRPDAEPRVTETMVEIVALIADLIELGLAYPAGGDVYFRVGAFPEYGRLSGRRVEDLVATDPGELKEDPLDFALWKGRKEDEDAFWESPWGPGRPGWHIECSAMAERHLGMDFAVHGGGIDLVFPHHENEIAQSEGARGGRFARIWMHNEMVELSDTKMSKSVGNIMMLADVLESRGPDTVIAYFLGSHYRSPLPFSDERLDDAAMACQRIRNAVRALDRALDGPGTGDDLALAAAVVESRQRFHDSMDDDLGTPGAMAAIFDLVRAIHQALERGCPAAGQIREVRQQLVALLDMLGLAGLGNEVSAEMPDEVRELMRRREEARSARDFAGADALRDAIGALGFELRDGPGGPEVYSAP
ncbi:MAG: cysteine--tRNA ligase [Thermoleophilia bacterium]|nr:cysteine--tRNA ligase [Thermoleophilia bacterium]